MHCALVVTLQELEIGRLRFLTSFEIFHKKLRFLAWKVKAKFELLNWKVSHQNSSILRKVSVCSFQNIWFDMWHFSVFEIIGHLWLAFKQFHDENFNGKFEFFLVLGHQSILLSYFSLEYDACKVITQKELIWKLIWLYHYLNWSYLKKVMLTSTFFGFGGFSQNWQNSAPGAISHS